jgi:putative transposase
MWQLVGFLSYITYIRLRGGWMYLVAVLDWYSRYVVSWELDQTLELSFVLTALERALAQATPTICNSDQGSHAHESAVSTTSSSSGGKN